MSLESIKIHFFHFFNSDTLNQYIGAIVSLLLRRLQNDKAERFTLGFVNFGCFFIAINQHGGPDYVIQAFDSIQPKYCCLL